MIMKSLGQRDFSAQETMHHLMSLKMVSSSFNVVPVSLDGSRRVSTRCFGGSLITNDSLLDAYANREKYVKTIPDIIELNFIDFASKYKLVNKKLTSQPENTIPRVFPVFSSNPKGPNFGLYCKYQLLRYKPWQTTQENAWDDQSGSDDILVHGKYFFKHIMLNTMYLIGTKNCKLYKIFQKMTLTLSTFHNNFRNGKSGCI